MQSSQKEALRQLAPFWGISAASMEAQKMERKLEKRTFWLHFF